MGTRLETLQQVQRLVGELIAAEEGTTAADVAPAPQAPPGFVAMPVTGHVLPVPSEADVSLWGYMMRCSRELGLTSPASISMANAASNWAGETPNHQVRVKWPEAADRAANPRAYMTLEELAAADAAEKAAQTGEFIPTRKPPPGPAIPQVGTE